MTKPGDKRIHTLKTLATFFACGCAALLAAGCAGGGGSTRQSLKFPSQTVKTEDSEKARIFVIRPAGDGPFTLLVSDGSKRVGSTAEAGYLCWERAPGLAAVTGRWDKSADTATFQAEKNSVHYLKLRLVPQMWSQAKPKLETVKEEEALQLIKKCKPPIANQQVASSVRVSGDPPVDLSKYNIVTVVPFATATEVAGGQTIGNDFADEIHELLKNSFGTFKEVRLGAPSGQPDEVVISGTVKAYDPGSRVTRFLIVGAGGASFYTDVAFTDASTKQVLLNESLDKFWAWGGMAGAAKGVDDMVTQSATAVAAIAARGKGWKP